jgi:transglutaminase-like putative cysteine protease
MILRGKHLTTYTYDIPVTLDTHTVRLQPRTGSGQLLRSFAITLFPAPAAQTQTVDAEGNAVHTFWFAGTTTHLAIETRFETENTRTNPFDFIPSPAATMPVQLSPDERELLRPHLKHAPSAEIAQVAQCLAAASDGSALNFVAAANNWIWQNIGAVVRKHGTPLTPETTLADRKGVCRDKAVLLIALCRAQGIPARFVSGYLFEDDATAAQNDLHAWAEAWIPGGGWRAFDATQGLATAERHVAVASSAFAALAAPVTGSFRGNVIARPPAHAIQLLSL